LRLLYALGLLYIHQNLPPKIPFQQILAAIAVGEIDPFNLKEDYEVLTGLTVGAEFWEIQQDLDILTKMIISRTI
jgi:hypothetical protein